MNLNDGSFQLEAAVAVLVSDSVEEASGALFFKSLGDDSGFGR